MKYLEAIINELKITGAAGCLSDRGEETLKEFERIKIILERLDEVKYVMEFASEIIYDNELDNEKNKENWTIGTSIDNQIDFLKSVNEITD